MFATRCLNSTIPAIRRAVSNNNNTFNNFRKTQISHRSNSTSTTTKRNSSAIAGDTGKKATHLHHHMTTALAVATPLYLFTPTSYTDGLVDKSFGILLASTISAHSWIGMNYVATDYVPKISKGLIGPVRVFNVVLGVVTFLGLSKIALNGMGGIKGALIGLWRPQIKDDKKKD